MTDWIHVAVAAVRRAGGEVLLAKRPPGRHLSGLWEFPGGKVEPGEEVTAALRRELEEELAIVPRRIEPLIRLRHRYEDRAVILDCWSVWEYEGTVSANEHQPLAWVKIDDLQDWSMPAADRAIVHALQLPRTYVITPEPRPEKGFFTQLARLLDEGVELLQLRSRHGHGEEFLTLARKVVESAANYRCRVVVNTTPQQAVLLGAAGVHLSSAAAARCLSRPVPPQMWCGVSCHNAEELRHAERMGADFAVLSPVKPTASHPRATPLGWSRFAALAGEARIPVYALGGLHRDDVTAAIHHGGQGVAGITGFWPVSLE